MTAYERALSREFWNFKVEAGRRLGQNVRSVEPTPTRVQQRNCDIRSLRLVLEDGTEHHVVTKDTRLHKALFKDDVHFQRTKRAYEVEIEFYKHLAGRLAGTAARTPAVYYSAAQDAEFLLILEDLSRLCRPAEGHCERACQREALNEREAKRALKWLADFHSSFLDVRDVTHHAWDRGAYWSLEKRLKEWHAMQEEWRQTCQSFECDYPSTFSRESVQGLAKTLAEVAEDLDAELQSREDLYTLVHGDFKTANIFFLSDQVAAIDFQWTGPGLGVVDVVYLLFSSVQPSVVFTKEQDLLYYYYEAFLDGAAKRGMSLESVYPWSVFKRHAEIAYLDYVRFSIGSFWGSITPTTHQQMKSKINLGMHRRNPEYLVQMVRKADALLNLYTERPVRHRASVRL